MILPCAHAFVCGCLSISIIARIPHKNSGCKTPLQQVQDLRLDCAARRIVDTPALLIFVSSPVLTALAPFAHYFGEGSGIACIHFPRIKPDVRFSGIRLSDRTSCHSLTKTHVEASRAFSAPIIPLHLMLLSYPRSQPLAHLLIYISVSFTDGSKIETTRPTG